MSSSDEVPPSEDPDFAALFRQAPSADLTHLDAEGHIEPEPEPMVQAADEPAPAVVVRSEPLTDTGRLFRSQGVTGNTAAVLALTSVQSLRLRTAKRSDSEAPSPSDAPPAQPSPPDASASFVAAPAGAQAAGAVPAGRRGRRERSRTSAAPSGAGLPARASYLIIIGVTLIAAFINALLASGDIGWPTGLAMLAATVFCALKVRREDDIVPVITPALAFFLTALTAAQLFLGSAERSLINRAVVVFFTLANNWIWILGTTVIALAIMLVRRRRG